MTTATDIIEKATNANNGQLNKDQLLVLLNDSGAEPDQNWEEQTTTWTFDDESAIRDCNGDIHVYGVMPKTDITDWYHAG